MTEAPSNPPSRERITFVPYSNEDQLVLLMELVAKDLSEPYSIFTYRYFVNQWPELSFLAMDGEKCVGGIVCKLDEHRGVSRGYIAMLVVEQSYRKLGLGTALVKKSIEAMKLQNCEEVVLETEIKNKGAMGLYENLGFIRDKRLHRYYLNGGDAFRLKLWLK